MPRQLLHESSSCDWWPSAERCLLNRSMTLLLLGLFLQGGEIFLAERGRPVGVGVLLAMRCTSLSVSTSYTLLLLFLCPSLAGSCRASVVDQLLIIVRGHLAVFVSLVLTGKTKGCIVFILVNPAGDGRFNAEQLHKISEALALRKTFVQDHSVIRHGKHFVDKGFKGAHDALAS